MERGGAPTSSFKRARPPVPQGRARDFLSRPSSLRRALATKQSIPPRKERWIASSLSAFAPRATADMPLLAMTGQHPIHVVPDKRARRALIRDPYAAADIISARWSTAFFHNSSRWLWVPGQARDDKWRGLLAMTGV